MRRNARLSPRSEYWWVPFCLTPESKRTPLGRRMPRRASGTRRLLGQFPLRRDPMSWFAEVYNAVQNSDDDDIHRLPHLSPCRFSSRHPWCICNPNGLGLLESGEGDLEYDTGLRGISGAVLDATMGSVLKIDISFVSRTSDPKLPPHFDQISSCSVCILI